MMTAIAVLLEEGGRPAFTLGDALILSIVPIGAIVGLIRYLYSRRSNVTPDGQTQSNGSGGETGAALRASDGRTGTALSDATTPDARCGDCGRSLRVEWTRCPYCESTSPRGATD